MKYREILVLVLCLLGFVLGAVSNFFFLSFLFIVDYSFCKFYFFWIKFVAKFKVPVISLHYFKYLP
ncbi:hypothetical protein IC582_023259 [Cucumis melo]